MSQESNGKEWGTSDGDEDEEGDNEGEETTGDWDKPTSR